MDFVARLLRLWTEPVTAPSEALAAFRELCTDPVSVNGIDVPVTARDSGL